MIEFTTEPIKFYRPDLKFAPIHDWPCGEEDCSDCDGINGPWKCGCTCHEMTDKEISALEGEARKVAA